MNELLFSYGTLQLEKVQQESFGRKLKGKPDSLRGYRLEQLKISDPDVLKKSQKKFHPIAMRSDDPNDVIKGTLFRISKEELAQADKYEVDDYQRVSVEFESGKTGWVYIRSTSS